METGKTLNVLKELFLNPTGIDFTIIKNVIEGSLLDFLTTLAGAVAVIYIILGGYQYLTSGGDPKKTAAAKATVLWAVIGLAIIISAKVIVTLWENLLKAPPLTIF